MKKIRKIIVMFAVLMAVVFGAGSVKAIDEAGSSLTFGPTMQRISLKPGESYRSSVFVSNPANSTTRTKFVLYIRPYSVINDNYDPVFDQMGTYTQIVDWITLDKTEGSIEPNETMEIGFTIKVPENAPAGGQYATIVAQDITNIENSGGGVNVMSLSAVGSVVVADVAGQTLEYGEIIENTVPKFSFNSSFVTTAGVKNDGNVHADVESVLQIWPLFSDEEIYTNEEDVDNSHIVLPDTTRYMFNTWNDAPLFGIFKARQTVTIFDEVSVNEKIIVICPLWLMFIIIFVIALLLIWFVSAIIKRLNKNKK